MRQLFEQIEQLIPTLHGWCTLEKALTLATLVLARKPHVVVEVGTWGGKSAIPMMLACTHNQSGRVVCIDPWKAEESIKGQELADAEWWSNTANHELVYQHFLYNVDKLGLGQYAEVHRLSSEQAQVPARIDLFHNDGNHGPQALADTMKFAPSIPVGGCCVLDDLDWSGGFVRKSEAWLLENGFVMLHPLGTGAVYHRLK